MPSSMETSRCLHSFGVAYQPPRRLPAFSIISVPLGPKAPGGPTRVPRTSLCGVLTQPFTQVRAFRVPNM